MAGLHQCPKCFYNFESADDLKAHEEEGLGCPGADEEVTVQIKESEEDFVIGPIEGAFLDNKVSAFVEAAQQGLIKVYKARVNGAPEGMDNTYALGILNGDDEFIPVMLLWTSAFSGIVEPRDPDITVHQNHPPETQETNGSKD